MARPQAGKAFLGVAAAQHLSLSPLFESWRDQQAEEGLFLEFKSGRLLDFGKGDPAKEDAARYDLAKAVASFANTEGGRVAIGIAENSGPTGYGRAGPIEPAPSGWRRDRILDWLDQDISPRIEGLQVEEADFDEGKLFLVEVPPSYTGHQNRGPKKSSPGEYRTRRATGVSAPLDGREVRQLVARTQLPDPVIALHVEDTVQYPRFDWDLYIVNRASILREAKVTLLQIGDYDREPAGFRRAVGMPEFSISGLVSIRTLSDEAVYPGSPIAIGQHSYAAKGEDRSETVIVLLQTPGVEARLFAWSLAFAADSRLVTRPPSPHIQKDVALHDPLGNSIPARWMV